MDARKNMRWNRFPGAIGRDFEEETGYYLDIL